MTLSLSLLSHLIIFDSNVEDGCAPNGHTDHQKKKRK